jgi:hypothetical protein
MEQLGVWGSQATDSLFIYVLYRHIPLLLCYWYYIRNEQLILIFSSINWDILNNSCVPAWNVGWLFEEAEGAGDTCVRDVGSGGSRLFYITFIVIVDSWNINKISVSNENEVMMQHLVLTCTWGRRSPASDCEISNISGGKATEVDSFTLTLDICSADGGQRSIAEVQVWNFLLPY